jgi:hypothetical protein
VVSGLGFGAEFDLMLIHCANSRTATRIAEDPRRVGSGEADPPVGKGLVRLEIEPLGFEQDAFVLGVAKRVVAEVAI